MAVLISRRHASTSGNSYTTPVDANYTTRGDVTAPHRLAEIRRSRGLTQQQVAERVGVIRDLRNRTHQMRQAIGMTSVQLGKNLQVRPRVGTPCLLPAATRAAETRLLRFSPRRTGVDIRQVPPGRQS